MRKFSRRPFSILLLWLLHGTALPSTPASVQESATYASIQPVTEAEARVAMDRLRTFLHDHLTEQTTGAITVNAVTDRPVVAGEARNHDALSEAVGQMLELALLEKDRAVFTRQMDLARQAFTGPTSAFLAWKIAFDPLRRADTSATLDDWRVVWAAAEGARLWPDTTWIEEARVLGKTLVEKTGSLPLPPPAFNLGDGSPGSGPVLLCYLHLPAMQVAALEASKEDQAAARALLERSAAVLAGLPGTGGIIPQSYDPDNKKYLEGPSDEVLALITLWWAREAGEEWPWMREMVDARRQWFRENGWLPQTFIYPDGRALPERAGAAVYALWARHLLREGTPEAREEAARALRLMLSFQNPPGSPFAGAIGGRPVFSFDQLEALLALADFLKN